MTLPGGPTGRHAWGCLGRFTSARQTLAALGSLYAAGEVEWACHRGRPGPEGANSTYWLLSSLSHSLGAQVLALHGGEVREVAGAIDKVTRLPPVTVLELLAGLPTRGTPQPGQQLLYVLTAAELLGAVVERTLTAGVPVSFVRVEGRALRAGSTRQRGEGGGGGDGERLLLILGTQVTPGTPGVPGTPERADTLPEPLVQFLAGLPRTSVCRPAAFCANLLLDVRMTVPAPDELFQPSVPEGELWLFGNTGDGPPLALRTRGAPAPLQVQPPDDVVRPPVREGRSAPPDTGPPPTPALRVVPSARASTRIDAALLTDDDLTLLRHFLPGRPLGERGHFAAGDGRHLLLAPDDLAAALPFGVPLRRIGPGACFLQSGHALVPELPPAARARTFGIRSGVAVVCWQDGWCTFGLERLVPLWTLWAPTSQPPVDPGVSDLARDILSMFETLTGRSTVHGSASPEYTDPGAVLERAARLYAEGRLAEAAEEYRAAGSPLEAARLYEEAALRSRESPWNQTGGPSHPAGRQGLQGDHQHRQASAGEE
ncbi:hypothetical protein ACWEQ7_30335, partial [Streptomyces sp. NPDC004069]